MVDYGRDFLEKGVVLLSRGFVAARATCVTHSIFHIVAEDVKRVRLFGIKESRKIVSYERFFDEVKSLYELSMEMLKKMSLLKMSSDSFRFQDFVESRNFLGLDVVESEIKAFMACQRELEILARRMFIRFRDIIETEMMAESVLLSERIVEIENLDERGAWLLLRRREWEESDVPVNRRFRDADVFFRFLKMETEMDRFYAIFLPEIVSMTEQQHFCANRLLSEKLASSGTDDECENLRNRFSDVTIGIIALLKKVQNLEKGEVLFLQTMRVRQALEDLLQSFPSS